MINFHTLFQNKILPNENRYTAPAVEIDIGIKGFLRFFSFQTVGNRLAKFNRDTITIGV